MGWLFYTFLIFPQFCIKKIKIVFWYNNVKKIIIIIPGRQMLLNLFDKIMVGSKDRKLKDT